MNQKNNGGPAFPVLNDGNHMLANMDAGQRLAEGMSLRDYFAAGFANAIYASTTQMLALPDSGRHLVTQSAAQTAEQAYEMADAMLAERAK